MPGFNFHGNCHHAAKILCYAQWVQIKEKVD